MSRKWYEIRAQGGSRSADLWIYDVIGVDFWGEGVDASVFSQDLAALDVDDVALHINSPGGNFFDAVAIAAAIVRHPAHFTSYIDGYAASAAWLVAQVANKRVMAANAFQMFHKAYSMYAGNDTEMHTRADMLTKIDDQQVSTALHRTSMSAEDMRAAMVAGDTWMNADDAMALGFADEVADAVKVAALTGFDFNALGIKSAPKVEEQVGPDSGGIVAPAGQYDIAALFAAHRTESRSEGGAPGIAASDTGGAPTSHDAELFVPGVGFRSFEG